MRRVPRFFVDAGAVRDGVVTIAGESATHLARSLRARPGERIVVVEAGRVEHGVMLTSVSGTSVSGRIEWSRPATGEGSLRVHVVQAMPARGFRDTIEALSIAGANFIHPVQTERTVVRTETNEASKKVPRWQAIAREAAQLAGRAHTPGVLPPQPLSMALAVLPPDCQILACVAGDSATPLRDVNVRDMTDVACVIGPEGGLGPRDLAALRDVNATLVHLGPRIIPTRLAGFLAVSLLLMQHGELESAPAAAPYEVETAWR